MVVEVIYGEHKLTAHSPWGGYAFNAPEGTKVGDILTDGMQSVTVVKVGSDYNGPMRWLRRHGVMV